MSETWQCGGCGVRFDTEKGLLQHIDRTKAKCDSPRWPERLAEAHWAYTEKMMHQAYVEAFVHGFGHGKENERRDSK